MKRITAEQAADCADMLVAWAKQEKLDLIRMRGCEEESTALDKIEGIMQWVRVFAGIIYAAEQD